MAKSRVEEAVETVTILFSIGVVVLVCRSVVYLTPQTEKHSDVEPAVQQLTTTGLTTL